MTLNRTEISSENLEGINSTPIDGASAKDPNSTVLTVPKTSTTATVCVGSSRGVFSDVFML
jgi:hypothetical protein